MKKASAQKPARSEPVTEIRAPESAAKRNAAAGARLSHGMFTVAHLIDSFKAHLGLLVKARVNEPTTLRWYADQLAALKPVEGFAADALRTHHLAAVELTNGFVRAVKRLYKWAAEEELVPKNPFAKLAVPTCGRRERVLTRDELRRLYLASPRAFRRLLFVQLHTMARPGEIRGLTWSQIDWTNRVIVVVKFKGKLRRRDKLKARCIPLDSAVVQLLRTLHRKSADPGPDGRVFKSPKGKPWTPNGVRCAMRRARKKAGLDGGDEPVVCYHLRHTAATEAVRGDLNLKLVAEVMGHARTSTTERYTHLDTRDVVGAIDRIHRRRRRTPAG
jgi:integrase